MRVAHAFLALALLPASAFGAGEGGVTALSVLERVLDGRAAGLGGAFAGVPAHIGALQYNPAGLAGIKKRSAAMTYTPGLGGGQIGLLSYAHPWKLGNGVLGGSVQYYNSGSINLNLSDGTTGKVTAEEDMAVQATYAFEPLPNLSLGSSFKFVRSELAEMAEATAALFDFGALWRAPIRGLSLGTAYQNFGPDIKYEEEGDPPPRTVRYGLSYLTPKIDSTRLDSSSDAGNMDFRFCADMVHALEQEPSPRLGVEMGLEPFVVNRVDVRVGWALNRVVDSMTFGVGFREGQFLLDYAVGPSRDLALTHQVTLSTTF